MRKEFNITGSCNPQWHYMVNTEQRFKAVEALIDKGKYFTINRARQYGKTTTLYMIWRRLSERYIVVPLSFEGLGDSLFASEEAFVKKFSEQMAVYLTPLKLDNALMAIWQESKAKSMDELAKVITDFCKKSPKPVVLTIDEVDKSSDNQLFLNFLGMLRNRYLERDIQGMDFTFHSVILAGFYYVEPQTRDNRRMDLVVTYGGEEFIIELKIWRGEKYEEQGRDQLASYLTVRGSAEGYLVVFDFSKKQKDTAPQWIENKGKRIFEVTI